MPESDRRNTAAWRVSGWSLRTKVAIVLVVPAVVALVLGGLRVQGQLDNANRSSTVRDQLAVLDESVALSSLVAAEMVGRLGNATDREERAAAVDRQIDAVRDAAAFTGLPATVDSELSDALGRLDGLRRQGGNPVELTEGYRAVLTSVADLLPAVVSLARNEELDDRATSLRSLLLLRATLVTQTALIQSGVDGSSGAEAVAAAHDAAAEEAVLGQRLAIDLPTDEAIEFKGATRTSAARRDRLQAALAGEGVAALPNLLAGLQTASVATVDLVRSLFTDLSDTVTARTNDARSDALRDSAFVLGALLAALVIALTVARSLLAPLHRLRTAALTAAHEQLPRTVERVRAGEEVDYRSVERVPVHTDEEIGQVARAFDDMHRQAVRLAGEQAELRLQVSEMFMALSRRSQSLVELQLGVIEELEAEEQDPQRLAGLFRLDHLATRLRRNGENLQVLAGGTPPRRGNRLVSVVELLRAATSEITDYQRVTLGNAPNGSVRASAAADLVHILAELLENATRFSPPERKVVLTADRGAGGGLLFEVVDGGLGMAEDDLVAANERLSTTDAVGPETTRRMGLFVVSQLAARHGVMVRLRPTQDASGGSGVTASIHVPGALVIADGAPERAKEPAMAALGARAGAPELGGGWPPAPDHQPTHEDRQFRPDADDAPGGWFTPVLEVDDADQSAWPQPEPASLAAPVRSRGDRPGDGNHAATTQPTGTHRADGRPTGAHHPTGAPAGVQPSGAQPTGVRPIGTQPGGAHRSGEQPPGGRTTGARPAGTHPAGAQPTSAHPTAGWPNGTQPASARPASPRPTGGNQPNGAQPAGAHAQPTGAQTASAQPTGTRPTGTQPIGAQPARPRPAGSQPNGAQPNGTYPASAQPTGPQPPNTRAFGTPPATGGVAGTTAAGLPMRKPAGRTSPEEASGPPKARPTGFRDPESIRNNLSRHYSGMQAARRARNDSDSTTPEPHG